MLLPERISEISGLSAQFQENPDPYPPIGFCPFADHELGNGDTFGLYWPFGREARQPIVCEIWHDEGALVPMFSTLTAFLDAARGSGERPAIPDLSVDPASPVALFHAARAANGAGQAQDARLLLQQAVEIVPEYTDAQALLAAVCRRLGQNEEAMRAAVQAIISPPCLGTRPVQLLRWLQSLAKAPEDLERDPIWRARQHLRLVLGGAQGNDDYAAMEAATESYLERRRPLRAVTLMQTYAELMFCETKSFQARYGFNGPSFLKRQRDIFLHELGTNRLPRLSQ
jgi:tetratricopeptide (TPR) repeat protein